MRCCISGSFCWKRNLIAWVFVPVAPGEPGFQLLQAIPEQPTGLTLSFVFDVRWKTGTILPGGAEVTVGKVKMPSA